MSDRLGVEISFGDLSAAEAGRAAAELRAMILDAGDGVDVAIRRADADSQSAGEILVAMFSTASAVAIAQGIKLYLAKRPAQQDGLTIRTADGAEVIATGAAATKLDAPALVRALQARKR